MEHVTITQISEHLDIKNLKGYLLRTLRKTRPTLSWDTLNRAFSEPEKTTKTLRWIRNEAKALLENESVESGTDGA